MDEIPGPPPVAQLILTLTAQGQISVLGPLENEMVCYYLLEKAKAVLVARALQAASRVQPPTPGELSRLTLVKP